MRGLLPEDGSLDGGGVAALLSKTLHEHRKQACVRESSTTIDPRGHGPVLGLVLSAACMVQRS